MDVWQEITAKMSAKRGQIDFGTEVEEYMVSEGRRSCLYTEQDKPEPVEVMVLERI